MIFGIKESQQVNPASDERWATFVSGVILTFFGMIVAACCQAGTPESPAVPEGITVDPSMRDQVKIIGDWKVARGTELGVTQTLLRKRNEISPKSVIFHPRVGKPGTYTLWLGLPKAYGADTAVPISIRDARTDLKFTFSAESASAVWAPIAEVEVDAGHPVEVCITDPGRLMPVYVGAIRLTPGDAAKKFPEPLIPDESKAKDKFEKVLFKTLSEKIPVRIENAGQPLMRNLLAAKAASASLLWRTMERSPERIGLWADTEAKHENAMNDRRVYRELLGLCDLMYAYYSPYTPASFGIRGNPQVVEEVKEALDWIVDNNRYSSQLNNALGGQWYDFEIGNPRSINALLTALHPFITPNYIEKNLAPSFKFMKDPRWKYGGGSRSSGASRIHLSEVQMGRGLLMKDGKLVADGREAALEAFVFQDRAHSQSVPGKGAPNVNGMYRDGSWVEHDNIAYNWGYGIGFMETASELASMFANTPWQFTYSEIKPAYDFYFLGLEPFWIRGYLYPATIGRALGQQQALKPNGQLMALAAGLLESAGPEVEKALQASLEKTYASIKSAGGLDLVAGKLAPITLDRMLSRLSGKEGIPDSGLTFSRVYPNMDRVMHHRPGYYAGLSMTSRRIANTETIFGCNLQGWYTGHGMLCVVDQSEPDRFSKNYWALVDPYRLPGVTLDKRTAPPGSRNGANSGAVNSKDWVGGASLSDLYSAAGMDLQINWSPLQAKKSWFFFDNEVVALGSGITSPDPDEVETVIENIRLDQLPNSLEINGVSKDLKQGGMTPFTNVNSLHLPANGVSKGMGVIFPTPSTVHALAQSRSGSWQDVFVKGDATPIKDNFLTVFLAHGSKPADASYAYILAPGLDAGATAALANRNPIEILAQTAALHAVRHKGLGITAANFFTPGKFPGYEADQPCSILLWEKNGEILLSLSDPTMKLDGSVTLVTPLQAKKMIQNDAGVEVVSLAPLIVKVNVSKTTGRSLCAKFQK